MKLREVKDVLTKLIETETTITPMLWGRHGLGKSSSVRQVGKELGYRVLDIRLAQKEAIDITGMLFTFEDKQLNMAVTANHPPQWFADALKQGKVILFLDEFNMARREVMNAVFELVLDRKLNNSPLPKNVFIVCAGNPEDDRYDVTPMSESLVDRLLHIKVEGDADGWLEYAESAECDARVVSFIRSTPSALYHVNKKDEKFPVEIKHSERSWLDRVNPILKLNFNEEIQFELLCGCVGSDMAALFRKTIQKENMPISVKEIFAGKKETYERLERYRSMKRQDLISITANDLVAYCLKNELESIKHLEKIKTFVKALPDEHAQMVISSTHKIGQFSVEFLADEEIAKKINTMNQVISEVKKAKAKK